MIHASPFENPAFNKNPFSLEETNTIQMALMEDDGSDPVEWIDAYSLRFRQLIDQEPNLHERYLQDPDACIAYIKNALKKTIH